MSTRRWKRRFTFKKPGTTTNSLNEVTSDPTEYMVRVGNVKDASGNETSFGEQMQHVGAVAIETSYPRSGRFPQPEDIVTWSEWGRTRTVNIKHVQRQDEDGRQITILCSEV